MRFSVKNTPWSRLTEGWEARQTPRALELWWPRKTKYFNENHGISMVWVLKGASNLIFPKDPGTLRYATVNCAKYFFLIALDGPRAAEPRPNYKH